MYCSVNVPVSSMLLFQVIFLVPIRTFTIR